MEIVRGDQNCTHTHKHTHKDTHTHTQKHTHTHRSPVYKSCFSAKMHKNDKNDMIELIKYTRKTTTKDES